MMMTPATTAFFFAAASATLASVEGFQSPSTFPRFGGTLVAKSNQFGRDLVQLQAFNPPTVDPDLVVGFGTIAAACTPYVLSLAFPKFFQENFFLPIYDGSEEEGRKAEIGWKVRYTTLALALTGLVFAEVYMDPTKDIISVLRDSYIVWALFYSEAIRKVRHEAKTGVIKKNRFGIQAWHSFVVLMMWADVTQSPVGQVITDFVKDRFAA